jgi:hypothetical protein
MERIMASFLNFGKIKAEGSAFVKVAEAEVKAVEAKGRIIAIDAANRIKNEVAEVLEKEAARVHADIAAVHERFDAILALL